MQPIIRKKAEDPSNNSEDKHSTYLYNGTIYISQGDRFSLLKRDSSKSALYSSM